MTSDHDRNDDDVSQGGQRMRYITLAAATLAAVTFAGAAYADSNPGPRQKGNQCWHRQVGDSLGYWSPCLSGAAEAARERLIAAGRTLEEADREAGRAEGRGAKATRSNASSNADNNTRNKPATRPISDESNKLKGANR
jgi:hypothetical protein